MSENIDNFDFNLEIIEPIVNHVEINLDPKSNLFKTICQQAAKNDNFVDWRQTLEFCGHRINHIYDGGYSMTAETFSLARKFCPLVKTINISVAHDNVQYVQFYLPQWRSLEEIELRGPAYIKDLLWSLKQLPQLRKLSLWNFDFGFSECPPLNLLTQLTHLEICHLPSWLAERIPLMLRKLLSLHIYTMTDKKTVRELAKQCTKLENLYLFDDKENPANSIAYFSNLKCLEVHDQSDGVYFLLNSLDERYNNQLEKLIIPGKRIFVNEAMRIAKLRALKTLSCVLPDPRCLKYILHLQLEQLSLYNCCNLNNNYLLFILRQFGTLRSLEITLCSLITPYFLKDALKILYRKGVKPENPFELIISGSGMTSDVKDALASLQYSNLLNLTLN